MLQRVDAKNRPHTKGRGPSCPASRPSGPCPRSQGEGEPVQDTHGVVLQRRMRSALILRLRLKNGSSLGTTYNGTITRVHTQTMLACFLLSFPLHTGTHTHTHARPRYCPFLPTSLCAIVIVATMTARKRRYLLEAHNATIDVFHACAVLVIQERVQGIFERAR